MILCQETVCFFGLIDSHALATEKIPEVEAVQTTQSGSIVLGKIVPQMAA